MLKKEIRASAHVEDLPIKIIDRIKYKGAGDWNKDIDLWYEYRIQFPGVPEEFITRFAEKFGGVWKDDSKTITNGSV